MDEVHVLQKKLSHWGLILLNLLKILEQIIEDVAYRLTLPSKLASIHDVIASDYWESTYMIWIISYLKDKLISRKYPLQSWITKHIISIKKLLSGVNQSPIKSSRSQRNNAGIGEWIYAKFSSSMTSNKIKFQRSWSLSIVIIIINFSCRDLFIYCIFYSCLNFYAIQSNFLYININFYIPLYIRRFPRNFT